MRLRTWSDATDTTTLSNYTTQIFFDDTITNTVLAQAPYITRTAVRDTTNSNDMVYQGAGSTKEPMLATLTQNGTGYTAAITIDVALLTSTSSTFPSVMTGGVVNAANDVAIVSPGSWISLYGTNLASTAYAAQSSDFVNDYLPTQLNGVSVQFDGKAAYLQYASPTQINALVPSDAQSGSVMVSVTNSVGMSNSVAVTLQPIAPGLFAKSGYAMAVRPADGAIINGTGAAVSGYTTSASTKTGDVLELFGTGFGPTQAGTAPGLVFSGADQDTNTVTATVGGQPATVLWAGLVGAGLWQITLQMPGGLTAGDNKVVLAVNGNTTQAGVSLNVAAS